MPLTLWLTDRSRYITGTGRCARERYLTNHFGPTGYGIVRKGESLPLATGSYVHTGLETLWAHLAKEDQFPTTAVIRAAIQRATEKYEKRIDVRGFRGLLQSERTDTIIREQQTLIAGLIWATCRSVLPWIYQHYRIIQAELESIYVLDCTCGLSSAVLNAEAHDARGCNGIGQMLKQDAIAEKRVGGSLAYFEAKTTGWGGDNWAPQWETKPQLGIGNFGIKERYDKEISENFILALYKGARKTSQPKDPFEEAVTRQESPFCYGYCKPGNPPMATDDWRHTYDYTDEYGASRRVSKAHQKRGVWELPQSDWLPYVEAKRLHPELSPIEIWISLMPQPELDKQVYLIGPLNRQDAQILSLKRQIVGEERHWQQVLWKLYEAQQGGLHWPSDAFQALLDELIPASWECRRFGVKHECQHKALCFKESGWEDPLGSGVWVPRRPHHAPELEAAISRGLLPEQGEEEDEDD